MNQTQAFRVLAIKALAIIGFVITVGLLVWLAGEGVKRAPMAFSSLASIAESVRLYRNLPTELSIATEKSAVNSGESFQISWTPMKRPGTYTLSYACTPGVSITVAGKDGKEMTLDCNETLSLPHTVEGVLLTLDSSTARITDVPLVLAFTSEDEDTSLTSEARITVANATIPVVVVDEVNGGAGEGGLGQEPAKDDTPVVVVKPVEVKPTVPTTPKPQAPVTTVVYPQSNPNGFVDLAVTTLGSGMLKNGAFVFTSSYDEDVKNAIKFDVKNIGTKTSGTWNFTTVLPDGSIYESPDQDPLKPLEHVEFTLGFDLTTNKDLVKIVNTAHTKNDTVSKNDSATWYVIVKD